MRGRCRPMGFRRIDAPERVVDLLERLTMLGITAWQAGRHLSAEGWTCSTADVENLKRMHGIRYIWRGPDDELDEIITSLLDAGHTVVGG